jgi:hypothetical protein
MNTRTNNSSSVRNVLNLVGALVVVASPAMAEPTTSYANHEIPVTIVKPEVDAGGISVNSKETPQIIGSVAPDTDGGWVDPRFEIADYDGNGKVDAFDLYNFYFDWVNGKETADINGDGFVDPADVWYFLAIWNSVINAGSGTGTGTGK